MGPASPEEQRFVMALITIYKHARAAAGYGPPPPELPSLLEAAKTVQELKPKFGEFWRRMAIARLGSSGLERPDFQAAIQAMGVDWHTLEAVLAPKIRAPQGQLVLLQKLALLYDSLRESQKIFNAEGVPSCDHTAPLSTAGPQPNAWSATATTTVFLALTTSQLATAADPQNWDNPCGKLFFNATYITEPKAGVFPVTACVASPGAAKPVNTEWHGYLYEDFLVPSFTNDFFDNILKIDSVPSSSQYSLTYGLEGSLCAQIAPDSHDNALFVDDGSLTGVDASNGFVFVTATKTIGFFDVFPHHNPADLAKATGPTLELLGDGLPYWLCCPK